jgi:hypothetical protein
MHLNIIKSPLFMLKVLMLHLFCLPMLVASCFNNIFLTKFLCIGSGLDLNVLNICFLMHSYMLNLNIWEHHRNYHVYLNGYKERAFGRQPIIFFAFSLFLFLWVLEVVTSVATSPYPFYFVFVPRVVSNGEEVRFGEVVVPKLILYCHEKINSLSQNVVLIWIFLCACPRLLSNFRSCCTFRFKQRKI